MSERFGLPADEPPIVKELDLEILDLEACDLLDRHPDWPKGTPRVPRGELVTAWAQMRWLVGYRVRLKAVVAPERRP